MWGDDITKLDLSYDLGLAAARVDIIPEMAYSFPLIFLKSRSNESQALPQCSYLKRVLTSHSESSLDPNDIESRPKLHLSRAITC